LDQVRILTSQISAKFSLPAYQQADIDAFARACHGALLSLLTATRNTPVEAVDVSALQPYMSVLFATEKPASDAK
jgi:hypothetical protein